MQFTLNLLIFLLYPSLQLPLYFLRPSFFATCIERCDFVETFERSPDTDKIEKPCGKQVLSRTSLKLAPLAPADVHPALAGYHHRLRCCHDRYGCSTLWHTMSGS